MAIDTEASRRASFVPGSPAAPFAVERAEGAYLITPDGRRILDAAGGAPFVLSQSKHPLCTSAG